MSAVDAMRLHIPTVVAAALLALGEPAHAQLDRITPGELALTPAYCQDVQTMNGWSKTRPSPRTPHWISLMGDSFWAMHHYCWALIRNRRAMAPGMDAMVRTGMLRHSIADYEFVLHNTAADFVLLPEIYYGLGENYLLLGDYRGAYEAFARAREIKPDYWPAYVRWADELVKLNLRAEAKALIGDGLRQAPDSPELIAQYRKLGGDPATLRTTAKEREPAASSASGASGEQAQQ